MLAPDRKLLGPGKKEIKHPSGRYCLGYSRSQSGTAHAHVETIDEDIVEDYVQDAHHDIQNARNLHVAAGLKHTAGRPAESHHRQKGGENGKITGSVLIDLGASSKPYGKGTANKIPRKSQQKAEKKQRHKTFAHYVTCAEIIFGTAEMGNLDGETGGGTHYETAEYPCARGYKSDRR